jgi:acyl-CoA thioester hydrolase
MGIVYYANYFVWMEIGRTDYCRECGFSYRDLERDEKAFIAVVEAACRYIAPARYDDEIRVRTTIESIKPRIMVFSYTILAADKVLAEGKTTHVVVGEDGKPKRLPERYVAMLHRQA